MAMRSQTQRAFLFGFLASIGATGLIGMYCLATGTSGGLTGDVLASTALVGAAAILGLAGAVVWEARRWHPLGPAGVVVSCVALLLGLATLWGRYLGNPPWWWLHDWWRLTASAWVLAVAVPHVGLLSLANLHRRFGWARRWTVVVIVLLTGLVLCLILIEWSWRQEILVRLVGILAIVDVCGTLAIPVFHRVSRMQRRDAVQTVELRLSLTCPRCSTAQEVGVGPTKCAKCGLKFRIEIEEEQCASCGYPLYRLESAVCPECGKPIARPQPTEAPLG